MTVGPRTAAPRRGAGAASRGVDAGEVTAEYACGVAAVVSMAATLYAVVTSPGMWDLVTRPIRVALSMLL